MPNWIEKLEAPEERTSFGILPREWWVRSLVIVWLVLLIPWVPFSLLMGMAFDAGYTVEAYTAVAAVWSYPIVLLAALFLCRKRKSMVLLPILSIAICILSGYLR